MTFNITTPHSPQLIVNIGITGHMDLPGIDMPLLEIQLDLLLQGIKAETEKLAAASGIYDEQKPVFYFISPLAEGSDRIAATAALRNSIELQCILPLKKEDYKTDFKTDESKKEFDSLLAKSTKVFELDIEFPERSQSYLNAGEIVLQQSDLLLAIWDGTQNNKIGGTGNIVAQAKEKNMPVLWINSQAPHTITLLHKNDEFADWQSNLIPALKSILIPDDAATSFNQLHLTEEPQKWVWSFVNTVFAQVLSTGYWRKSIFKKNNHIKNAYDEWSRIWDKMPTDNTVYKEYAEEKFKSYYVWLDYLSLNYGDNYRSAGILRHTAYFLATIGYGIGFYYGFWYKNGGNSNTTVLFVREFGFATQAIFLGIIIKIYKVNEKNKWHQKFIDYRILAEMMRHSVLLASLGSGIKGISLPVYLKKEEVSWINWYYRAIVRQAGIPCIVLNVAQLHYTKNLVLTMLEQQVAYHTSNQSKNNKIGSRLNRYSKLFYWATIIVVAMRVAVYALGFITILNEHYVELGVKVFNVFCLLFPALALLFQAIALQGGYDILAQRSAAMKDDLEKLMQSLEKQSSYKGVKNIAEKAAALMISEVTDWRLFVNTKIVKNT